jgi:acetate kinase
MKILVLNAGSSSLKLSLYELEEPAEPGVLPHGLIWEQESDIDDSASERISALWQGADAVLAEPAEIALVGHRIVHGGAQLAHPMRITSEVRAAVARVAEYAPSHNAAALHGIDTVTSTLGKDTPQIAVFDTAFHVTLSPAAYTYAGPRAWVEQGIRRYGFHGISHQYASERVARLLGRSPDDLRIVTCHLGSGCSLAAVTGGRSVDTTMGFTPLDGIPMARRSGTLDPGILIHLLRHGAETVESLGRVLNEESGLAGLSGTRGDMRDVLAAVSAGDAAARLALDVYVHRIRQGIASMAASMGGVNALVFTAGVGENAAVVRSAICAGLAFLGVAVDTDRNAKPLDDAIISAPGAMTPVLVVHARENWMVANAALRTVG